MNERLDKQMDFIREMENVGKMMQNTHGIWQL